MQNTINTNQLPIRAYDYKRGSLIAIPFGDDLIAYVARTAETLAIYPVASRGGLLPLGLFKGAEWQWLFEKAYLGKEDYDFKRPDDFLPEGCHFAGIIDYYADKPDYQTRHAHHWWYSSEFTAPWGSQDERFMINSGVAVERNADGKALCASSAIDETKDLRALLLSNLPRRYMAPSLLAFLQEHRHEMIILERPFANLLDHYSTKTIEAWSRNALSFAKWKRLEVLVPSEVQPPEGHEDMEDFLHHVLSEAELGGVGEFMEFDDHSYACCDVERVDAAAKVLIKALKKAGFSKGFEIKEKDGKGRMWTLSS